MDKKSSGTKNKIIASGLSGLVGSRFASDFSQSYDFETIDISDPVKPIDITQPDQVMSVFEESEAETVVHLAAFTDVTKSWEQKDDKQGLAYKVNVDGTKNIVEACQKTNKHLIHISTAFVFDGQKEGFYTEKDQTNPIEWYGQTKAWAEEVVQESSASWTILRIDFPFRSDPFPKPDIVRKIVATMEKGYPVFANHYFGPTYVDDFSKVMDWAIRTKTNGLFNASSGEKWSDFELADFVNKHFELGLEPKKGDLDEYLKTLNRPYQRNTAMNNDKLKSLLDFELLSIKEALLQVQLP